MATQLRTEFTPRRNELMNEAAKLYAARFTEQELKDMAAFYKSPLGKKMLARSRRCSTRRSTSFSSGARASARR